MGNHSNDKFEINVISAQPGGLAAIMQVQNELLSLQNADVHLVLLPEHATQIPEEIRSSNKVTIIEKYDPSHQTLNCGRDGSKPDKIEILQTFEKPLIAMFEDADMNVFVGGFAQKKNQAVYLSSVAQKHHCPCAILASLPIILEGKQHCLNSFETLADARESADWVLIADAELLYTKKNGTTLADVYKDIDKAMGKWLVKLCEANSVQEMRSIADALQATLPIPDRQERLSMHENEWMDPIQVKK